MEITYEHNDKWRLAVFQPSPGNQGLTVFSLEPLAEGGFRIGDRLLSGVSHYEGINLLTILRVRT